METSEQQAQNPEENVLDVGNEILSWETWEFPPVERSHRWYIAASVIGLFLLLYALFTANFVFGIIILMFAVITIMRDLKRPGKVPIYLTTTGIVFGNEYFRYEDIRDFSIAYEPPTVTNLYVSFHGRLKPTLSIHLEGMNPNEVRQALLPFVYENLERDGESLTDILRRVYKL